MTMRKREVIHENECTHETKRLVCGMRLLLLFSLMSFLSLLSCCSLLLFLFCFCLFVLETRVVL